MKNLLFTLAFTFAGSALFAQATPATPATPAKPATPAQKEARMEQKQARMQDKACPMPDIEAVNAALDLTPEQLAQVREIHAECERDCAQAKATRGTVDKDAMAKHQERVKEVLTDEQYERYQALAAERKAEKGEMKKEMKGAQRNAQ